MLTTDQRGQFHRDGYLVLPGFKAIDQIALLRERAAEIVDFEPGYEKVFFVANDAATVPEPASLALLGLGLLGFAAARKRKS